MLKHYLTTALRHFRQHKLTTAINVVCLTIGLGCFLAIYATIEYVSSSENHFPNADRTYMITWTMDDSPVTAWVPWIAAEHLRTDFPELKSIARSTFDSGYDSDVPITAGENKSFAHVIYADPEFLDVFALPFLSGDSRKALREPRSAVISKDTAIKLFGDVRNAAGKTLRLQDGRLLNVRGVLDKLRQPSHISTDDENNMGMVNFNVLVSLDVLKEEAVGNPAKQPLFSTWVSPFFFTYVVLPEDNSFTADDLRDRLLQFGSKHASVDGHTVHFGAWPVKDFRLRSMGALVGTQKTGISATMMLYFLGVIVLGVSCLNYANLATAQATTRAKEIGMRRVVGAHRKQIITQFMMEAAVLSFIALLIATFLVTMFMIGDPLPAAASIVVSVGLTLRFWAMLVVLLAAVTLAAGLYPAFVLSNVRPIHAVRAGKNLSGGRFVPQVLVGLQFAGASFLLISMFVMVGQNAEFKRTTLGTTSDPLVVLSNNVRSAGLDYELFRSELLRQPHVRSVTASVSSPWAFIAPGANASTSLDGDAHVVNPTEVGVNYDFFSTLGINVLAGREFDRAHGNDAEDARSGANTPNVMIDRALAEQSGWSNPNDAIGKILFIGASEQSKSQALPSRVIGVVENRPMTVVNVTGTPSNLYVLKPKVAAAPIVLVSRSNPAAGMKEVESIWNRLAPSVALRARFADEELDRTFRAVEGITTVFGGVAAFALVISVLGLFGMSIHAIGRRQHEIGVRKTLGASVRNIVKLLLTDFSKPVIIANILVWPLAFVAMQFYLSIFAQRGNLSIVPFAAGLGITVLIAWISVAAQATRAARMSPVNVLRHE